MPLRPLGVRLLISLYLDTEKISLAFASKKRFLPVVASMRLPSPECPIRAQLEPPPNRTITSPIQIGPVSS